MKSHNCQCPDCGQIADRITKGVNVFIYCVWCGCNTLARSIKHRATKVAKPLTQLTLNI